MCVYVQLSPSHGTMGRFVVFLIIFIVVVFAYPYFMLMFTYWVFHSCTRRKYTEILGMQMVQFYLFIRESWLNSIMCFCCRVTVCIYYLFLQLSWVVYDCDIFRSYSLFFFICVILIFCHYYIHFGLSGVICLCILNTFSTALSFFDLKCRCSNNIP